MPLYYCSVPEWWWKWWSVRISGIHHSPSYLLLLHLVAISLFHLLLWGLNLLLHLHHHHLCLVLSWRIRRPNAANSWTFRSFHLPRRTSWLISFQHLRIAFTLSFFLAHSPLMFSITKAKLPLPKLPFILDQLIMTPRWFPFFFLLPKSFISIQSFQFFPFSFFFFLSPLYCSCSLAK